MEEKWYFTFGVNHIFSKRYVVIDGSYVEAREKMFNVFGGKWSMQYSFEEFEPQIEKYNLSHLGVCQSCLEKINEVRNNGLSD